MTDGKKRAGTWSDEDRANDALRRRRTPGNGVHHGLVLHASETDGIPSASEDWDGLTGRYEGPELDEMRDRRAREAPATAMRHLENKVEELGNSQHEFQLAVTKKLGEMEGGMGKLAGAVDGLKTAVETASQRAHVTFTADVEVSKRERIDVVDKRKARRDFVVKAFGFLITGGVLAKLLAWAGVL